MAAQTYLLSTIAGTTGGYGDGGPASQARLSHVTGLTADANGNVYIVDTGRVRKVTVNGLIETIAGIGLSGDSGDEGPATAAITNPSSIAAQSGFLFIVESADARIRRVTPDGIIHEFAGTGVPGYSGDGGPAALARIGSGASIAADASGNLYILDSANLAVRQVAPTGIITTVATVSLPYGAHGLAVSASGVIYIPAVLPPIVEISQGQQTSLTLKPQPSLTASSSFPFDPTSLAVDPNGTIFALDGSSRLASIAPDGTASLVATIPDANFVAVDGLGSIYVCNAYYPGALFRVAVDGTISTVVGAGIGDGGPASEAFIDGVFLAADSAGNTYIGESANYRIRKIAATGVISTIAGTGVSGFSGDGGPAAAAQISGVGEIVLSSSGDLYFADNYRVRKISNGVISTIAGTGVAGYSGDGGQATQAQIFATGLAFDATGNLYISDPQHTVVRKVSVNGTISTVAGNGKEGSTGDGGPATQAELQAPTGLAVDSAGNLFIADTASNNVRRVDANGIVTTAASNLSGPFGMVFDPGGNLYVTCSTGYVIVKIAPGGSPQAIAGTGISGVAGDEGPSLQGQLANPLGIALSPAGNLLFMDHFSPGSFVRELSTANIFPLLVVNAASQLHAFPSAGELVTIYWTGIGAQTAASATQVLFDGVPALILYANASQANVMLPVSLAGHAGTNLTVKSNGITSNTITLPLRETDPGIFTLSGTGTGQAAILNQDNSLNSTANPAASGSVIQIFGTGASAGFSTTVSIGGVSAAVQYSGPAPGIPGVFQVNAVVPLVYSFGAAAQIVITFDGVATQIGATVALTGRSLHN